MFKGLKSKLAEETKKLQNAVSQVAGDGIGGFARGRNHENSGDTPPQHGASSNPGFKLDESDNGMLVDVPLPGDSANVQSPALSANQAFSSANSSFASFFDMDNSSTLVEEEQIQTRQRRDSAGSVGSMDSIFSPQVAFSNTNRLSVINSDLETDNESVAGSTFVSAASKEQISGILNRLQGRAANYKDRYRQLVKIYNEVVRENDKVRTILTTTQDKALRRIQELREEKRLQEKAKRDLEEGMQSKIVAKEKMINALQSQVSTLKDGNQVEDSPIGESAVEKDLQTHKERVKKLEELLSRCKESMKSYKERIDALSTENEGLKQQVQNLEHEEGSAAISDFVNDRVASQYKTKMQEAEEEWNKRIAECEERSAMVVAETKQEMHAELERKDQTIEALREKVKELETAGLAEVEELKTKLHQVENAEKILEDEKKDLAEQLSRAKHAAVQIVQEEENAKREKLEEEWQNKLTALETRYDAQLRQAEEDSRAKLAEKTKEYNDKLREYEEQAQLAIEERELQKSAVATKFDERIDQLLANINQLKTEKLELESSSERRIEELMTTIAKHSGSMDISNAAHAEEIQKFTADIEQLSSELAEKSDQLLSASQNVEKLQQLFTKSEDHKNEIVKNLEEQIAALQRRAKEEIEGKTIELLEQYEEKIWHLEESLNESQSQLKRAETEHEETIGRVRSGHEEELARKEQEWRMQLEQSADEKAQEYLSMIDQLRQEKSNVESESERKVAELVSTMRTEHEENLSMKEQEWRTQYSESTDKKAEEYQEMIDQLKQEKLQLESSSERRIAELMSKIASHVELLDTLNSAHEVEINQLNEQLSKLSVDITDKNDQLAMSVENVQKLEQLMNASEERRKEAMINVQDQAAVWEGRANEILETKDRELAEYEDRIKRLEETLRENQDEQKVARSEHEETLKRVKIEHEKAMSRKEEEWRAQQSESADERANEYLTIIDQLREEKSNLQRALGDKAAELQTKVTSLNETLENHNSNHSLERDRLTAENDALRADLARKDEQLKSIVKELEKHTARQDQLMQLAQDEWNSKAKDYDDRIAILERSAQDELDAKLKTAVAEHNEKVKQLCRDFQLEMSKKENEWQTELNGAYSKSEEDRHRAVREYQKEAKQLHQELQEKSKRFNELKAAMEQLQKEKENHMEEGRKRSQDELAKLEEQMNLRMKQRMEDMELKHKQELDGLTTEWTTERRLVPAAVQTSSSWSSSSPSISAVDAVITESVEEPLVSSQLEVQAQIAQGDVRQESPMYLKQRVRQLEAQIEAMKEKQRKELELLVKGSANPPSLQGDGANGPASRPRLASVSLDVGSSQLFAEPTEAEYLKNILFRYMTERESLGKESVTLAKAIAAVLKFSNDQTHVVVAKEEGRASSNWLPMRLS